MKWLFTELAGGQLRKLVLCTFLPACFLSSSSFLLPFLLLALLCPSSCPVISGPPMDGPGYDRLTVRQWTHSCLDSDDAVLPWRHVTAFCSASSSFWAKTGEWSGWNEMIPLRASGDEHKHSFDFLWNHFYTVTFLWQINEDGRVCAQHERLVWFYQMLMLNVTPEGEEWAS